MSQARAYLAFWTATSCSFRTAAKAEKYQSYGKLIAQELGQWGEKNPRLEDEHEKVKLDYDKLTDAEFKELNRLCDKMVPQPPKPKLN